MRGLFTLVLVTITALVAGFAGFQLGVASNIGSAGTSVVWYGGFPFFGGFLFLLSIFLFFGLLRFAFGPRHGSWGWGPGYGPGGEGDPRRRRIADAHRRLHEEEARTAGTTAAGGTGSPDDRSTAG